MIDIRFLAAHSLWIGGTSLVFAALGYYGWAARTNRLDLRAVLRGARGWRRSLPAGVLLAAVGFLLMPAVPWWERALWLIVASLAGSDFLTAPND